MKIVCVSDTHCQLDKVKIPKGDVLVHAGDLTYRGTKEELEKELDILCQQPHKTIIVVAGNHDILAEPNPELMRELCSERGIIYLQDDAITIDGIKFYGSPYQPSFNDWAFGLPRGESLRQKWAQIPEDTNVLITHGPPRTLRDLCPNGNVGCEELFRRINVLPFLKAHIFGHIHESYGSQDYADIKLVNASICTGQYRPTNKPITITLAPQ